jgi:hypothetical protein
MKPLTHVTVVKVDFKRQFFTEQGLPMNNVGKKIALKMANVVTTTLQEK